MDRLLFWLSGRLPVRIICEEGAPYLERYYVASIGSVRCYLHRFVGSDPDRGLHDHPWARAVSILLSGWYFEERRDGVHRRRWWNWIGGDTFHRVILPDGQRSCWSLFFHGRRVKTWGFLSGNGVPGYPSSAAIWTEFQYGETAGEERRWWRYAPLGRDEPRRMPL